MRKFLVAGILLCIGVGGVIAWFELPILFARNVAEVQGQLRQLEPISLEGDTLFVSDFHFVSPEEQVRFPLEGIRNIVIIGDWYHSESYYLRFGANRRERIEKGLRSFLPQEFSGSVYFISAYTHDPQLAPFEEQYGSIAFSHVGHAASFAVNGTRVVALHGNELHGGAFGGGVSWLAGRFGQQAVLERFAKKYFGVEKETWFLAGHSHVPGFDELRKVGNTGSFAGVPFNSVLRIHVGTGILFPVHGEPRMIEFEGIVPTRFP